MITENLSTLKIHKLTQVQYDRELEAGNIDGNALYLTPDEEIDLTSYATIEQVNTKADANHNHDDIYYTESEIDSKISTLNTSINGKAASSHSHVISDITNLQSTLNSKVSTSRTINGKSLSSNVTLSASDVSAYSKTEIDDMAFITVDDIDTICGTTISLATAYVGTTAPT